MNLYLPVEVKNRELYSKVLLAKFAAEKGFNVILGRKNDLNRIVVHMPAGVYFGLGVPENYEEFYRTLTQLGNMVVVCEEEGLITYTDEMYMDMRISLKTMQYVDVLFSWGEDNQNLIASRQKELAPKIKVSGHPRFDLLKPEYSKVYKKEIDIIRKKYKRYILVCTCFPSSNHFLPGIDYVQSLIDKRVLKTQKNIDDFKRYQKVKSKTMQSFLDAIPLLAETCRDTKIVIRPHPSENKTVYLELAEKFSNVHVEANVFSVHPWILAAEVLVHHYCATSVEAYAAGVPRFALRPEADPRSEKEIPFECSEVCTCPDELVKAINGYLLESSKTSYGGNPSTNYSDYVLNIGDVVSAQLLIDEISDHLKNRPVDRNGGLRNQKTWINEIVARSYISLREHAAVLLRRNTGWRNYTMHKFDKLDLDEIQDLLTAFDPDEDGKVTCKKRGGKLIQISGSR